MFNGGGDIGDRTTQNTVIQEEDTEVERALAQLAGERLESRTEQQRTPSDPAPGRAKAGRRLSGSRDVVRARQDRQHLDRLVLLQARQAVRQPAGLDQLMDALDEARPEHSDIEGRHPELSAPWRWRGEAKGGKGRAKGEIWTRASYSTQLALLHATRTSALHDNMGQCSSAALQESGACSGWPPPPASSNQRLGVLWVRPGLTR